MKDMAQEKWRENKMSKGEFVPGTLHIPLHRERTAPNMPPAAPPGGMSGAQDVWTKQALIAQKNAPVSLSAKIARISARTSNQKMDDIEEAAKNTVYVTNLPQNIDEETLGKILGQFDRILNVRLQDFIDKDGFPNTSVPPFGQVHFATDKGVLDACKASGVRIKGQECRISVIHPNLADGNTKLQWLENKKREESNLFAIGMGDEDVNFELIHAKKISAAEMDRRVMKTVHIADVAAWMSDETIKGICEACFGTVLVVRVDTTKTDGKKKRFALVEFDDPKSAMLALRQKTVEVEGCKIQITASKALANEEETAESQVTFGHATYRCYDAFGAAATKAEEVSKRLEKVKSIATDLGIGTGSTGSDTTIHATGAQPSAPQEKPQEKPVWQRGWEKTQKKMKKAGISTGRSRSRSRIRKDTEKKEKERQLMLKEEADAKQYPDVNIVAMFNQGPKTSKGFENSLSMNDLAIYFESFGEVKNMKSTAAAGDDHPDVLVLISFQGQAGLKQTLQQQRSHEIQREDGKKIPVVTKVK